MSLNTLWTGSEVDACFFPCLHDVEDVFVAVVTVAGRSVRIDLSAVGQRLAELFEAVPK